MKLLLPFGFLLLFTLFQSSTLQAQFSGTAPFRPEQGGLLINEFSNGEGGNNVKEYIELVVIGSTDAPQAPVDLEGWILDDNNIAISGQGSATGHLIFGDCFSAVNPGSIIVIYNGLDRNPALPADDPTDADRDGVYVLSHTDDCLRGCNITPSSSSSVYCPCPDTGETLSAWPLGLRNGGDVVQVRDRCESVVHAIYWGGVSITPEVMDSPTSIDMGTQNQSGRLIAFLNTNDDNWHDRANFDILNFNTSETPGAANSTANENYITALTNGTVSHSGTISLCYDTDAGDLVLPQDAGFFTSPIELCSGEDIGSFQVTYLETDENEPDAPGFNYEYAFILTQNISQIFTIIDFNTDGDFDFSGLDPGTYQVWGFSFIQTNGEISVSDFLASGFTNLNEIEAYSECGYDGNIDNLDAMGNAVIVTVFEGINSDIDLSPFVLCEENNGEATFDLTSYNDSISTELEVTWYKDEETAAELDPANSFLSASTTVFAAVDNDFCESEAIPLELIVVEQAVLTPPSQPLQLCEESNGQATFDLIALTDSIIVENATSLVWFEDQAGTIPIDNPATFLSANATVFATVENETCTSEFIPVVLAVSSMAPVTLGIAEIITCEGTNTGALTLSTSDPLDELSFDWNVDALDGTANPTGLTAGEYAVTVTNAIGCEQLAQISLTEPVSLQLSCGEIMPASANDIGDGQARIDITGGTAPYTLMIDGPVPSTETVMNTGSVTLEGLLAGSYTVSVRDANDCETPCMFDITFEPPVCDILLTPEISFISCTGESDGEIRLEVSGGRAPYAISWEDGNTSFERLDLPPGTYNATITDENNCEAPFSTTLINPDPLVASISTISNGCESTTQVLINQIEGGNGPYEFSPDGVFFTPISTLPFTFDGLAPGDYNVAIRDAGGCITGSMVSIEAASELLLELGPDIDIQLGDSILLKPQLNFDPAIVSWSPETGISVPDALDAVFKPTFTTTYTLTLTDAGGCSISDQITFLVDRKRPIFIPNAFSPNGDGVNDTFTLYAGVSVDNISQLRIFDRWGNLLYDRKDFQANNPDVGWDGSFQNQLLNPGVFTYVFEVLYMDGETAVISGEVALVK